MLNVNGVIGAIFEMHLGNRFYYFAHNMENSDVMVSREMYIFSKLSVLLISNILEIYTTFILRIWISELFIPNFEQIYIKVQIYNIYKGKMYQKLYSIMKHVSSAICFSIWLILEWDVEKIAKTCHRTYNWSLHVFPRIGYLNLDYFAWACYSDITIYFLS